MIRKFLLIGDSGILQFYLDFDQIKIDADLLSGFCKALYEVSLELTFPLKNVGFEQNTMIVESVKHTDDRTLLLAMIFDDYHIDEGINHKIQYIYDKFFKQIDYGKETKRLNEVNLDQQITYMINNGPQKDLIIKNLVEIKEILDPILMDKDNGIHGYSINSADNSILYCNGTFQLVKNRTDGSVRNVIEEYLLLMKQDKIPQGDKFMGLDYPEGLDLINYVNTGYKTLGIVINTSINLKEEPKNELLLYFFGVNTLMRSCVLDIENSLRNKITVA